MFRLYSISPIVIAVKRDKSSKRALVSKKLKNAIDKLKNQMKCSAKITKWTREHVK